ncbi:sirohydrochlorin ferrochelatase [Flavimobilis soli]|uniref:Sirohydrochlorin ferrochelatase n=1 Tax=Flavimobilis soli TaxID=442709 RepID=A0A2A9EDL9_9MICO|nr:sirohydrochlorin chelatase [Flavimobilis soli]PFG36320.1 sirohydrochlorin ferrochelatase [Flavimobilis soli]
MSALGPAHAAPVPDAPAAAHAAPARTRPALVATSHGTDNLDGRAAVASIAADVRAARPGLTVREAFVDVQEPEVADVVAEELARTSGADGLRAVVVPLLLSAGFHTYVDIAEAAEPDGAVATGALGPDVRLADIVVERLHEAGATPDDTVVLAAAGSSDPRAAAAVEEMLTLVRERWSGAVTIGYGAGAEPRVPDAVTHARAAGATRVVVASYLLAPGFFLDRLHEAGADVVTAPLAPDPRLAQVVLDRYDDAVSGRATLR